MEDDASAVNMEVSLNMNDSENEEEKF